MNYLNLDLQEYFNFEFVTPREIEGEKVKAVFQTSNEFTFILTASHKLCGYYLYNYLDEEDYECYQIRELEYENLVNNIENLFYDYYFRMYKLFKNTDDIEKVIRQAELEEELKFKEEQKKRRYQEYLKLKEEFENNSSEV